MDSCGVVRGWRDAISCVRLEPHLFGRVAGDELVVDAPGLGRELGSNPDLPVVLAGHVEGYVLLAELGHQEGREGTQSI